MTLDPLHSVRTVATHPARGIVIAAGVVGAPVAAVIVAGALGLARIPDPAPPDVRTVWSSCDVSVITPECREALPSELRGLPDLDAWVAWRVEQTLAIARSDADLGISVADPVAHLVWEVSARDWGRPVEQVPLSSNPLVADAERALKAEVAVVERETELAARRMVLPVLWSGPASDVPRPVMVAGSPWVHQELHAVGRIVRRAAPVGSLLLGSLGLGWLLAWRRTAPVPVQVTPHRLTVGPWSASFDDVTAASWSDGVLVTLASGDVWALPSHRVAAQDLPALAGGVQAGLRAADRSVELPGERAAVVRLARQTG